MDTFKVVSALGYLASNVPELTKLKACKMLFFADKEHLLKYGRFITQDIYHKLDLGPVPSFTLNLINMPSEILTEEDQLHLNKYITFSDDKFRVITCRKNPDLEQLSDSEIEVLDQVIDKYGRFNAGELIEETHKEHFWNRTPMYQEIDFTNLIGTDLDPAAVEALREIHKEDKKTAQEFSPLLK